MIFISGVHGVGKTYFCRLVKDSIGIDSYAASRLIAEKKQQGFSKDKLIPDIDENQQYLLHAINELRLSNRNFILDGHFCLLNAEGTVHRIPFETFSSLQPDAIVLLTESPLVIANRRSERDHVTVSPESIDAFQKEEIAYAKEVAEKLNTKLFISEGSETIDKAVSFIGSL